MATAVKTKPEKPTLAFPQVQTGDMVHWYHGTPGDSTANADQRKPCLAIVTDPLGNAGMASLAILRPGSPEFWIPDDSQPHADHPESRRHARSLEEGEEYGFWDVPPNRLMPHEVRRLRYMLVMLGADLDKFIASRENTKPEKPAAE